MGEKQRKRKERRVLGRRQKTKKDVRDMRVMAIFIVIGALGKDPKGLISSLEEFKVGGRDVIV